MVCLMLSQDLFRISPRLGQVGVITDLARYERPTDADPRSICDWITCPKVNERGRVSGIDVHELQEHGCGPEEALLLPFWR